MEKVKKIGMAEYITIAFYAAFITLPFLFLGGANIADGFYCTFRTFPTNYLLYISPAIVYFFLKKSDIQENDRIRYLLALDTTVIVILHTALQTNRSSTFLSLIAIVILSVVCININDIAAATILLPGLLLATFGTEYIFATYIPVLLLLMINSFGKTQNTDKKDKKSPLFILFAYLYIIVIAVILLISKKIIFMPVPAAVFINNSSQIISFTSGIILVLTASVLFVIRALPVLKNGKLSEKISIILFAVYPVILTAINSFLAVVTNEVNDVVLLSLVIYIMGNIQLEITYNDRVSPVIPEKLNNTACTLIATTIFCTFSFK